MDDDHTNSSNKQNLPGASQEPETRPISNPTPTGEPAAKTKTNHSAVFIIIGIIVATQLIGTIVHLTTGKSVINHVISLVTGRDIGSEESLSDAWRELKNAVDEGKQEIADIKARNEATAKEVNKSVSAGELTIAIANLQNAILMAKNKTGEIKRANIDYIKSFIDTNTPDPKWLSGSDNSLRATLSDLGAETDKITIGNATECLILETKLSSTKAYRDVLNFSLQNEPCAEGTLLKIVE